MLTSRAKDLKVEFRSVKYDRETNTGKAHWEAW